MMKFLESKLLCVRIWGSKVLRVLGDRSIHFAQKLYISEQSERVKPWVAINGDSTLRLDYDLNEDSIVFDVGGYLGNWASDIFCRYQCHVHIFEPIPEFVEHIQERFCKNKRIIIYPFGLAGSHEKIGICVDNDSSSTYRTGKVTSEVILESAADFIETNQITKIHLMKINIEGGEYELLNHLLDHDLTKIIDNIQIQFHDFIDGAKMKRISLQQRLSTTHYLTYEFPFVWENWRRK